MTDERELDELETSMAKAAVAFLKTIVQVGRLQHAEDAETVAELDALKKAGLQINVDGPHVSLELFGLVKGKTKLLYAGGFDRVDVLH